MKLAGYVSPMPGLTGDVALQMLDLFGLEYEAYKRRSGRLIPTATK